MERTLHLLDVNRFIEKYKTGEVKNANYPTQRGIDSSSLWSEEIFGRQNSNQRMEKVGFINLSPAYIINPLVYGKMKSSSLIARNILYSLKKYKLDNTDKNNPILIESDDGRTGIKYMVDLIANNNINFTNICKTDKLNVGHFLDKNKKNLIIDKILVMPAGLRDVSTNVKRGDFVNELNKIYERILFFTDQIKLGFGAEDDDTILEGLQKTAIQHIKYLETQQAGKKGLYRSTLMRKNVDYSSRLVAVGNPNIGIGYVGIPWNILISLFKPFFIHEILKKDPILKQELCNFKNITELNLKDIENIIKTLINNLDIFPDELKELMKKSIIEIVKDKQVLIKRDPAVSRVSYVACDLTVMDSGHCVSINPGICDRLNGDFDGDTIAIYAMHTIEENEEAKKMNPLYSKNAYSIPASYNDQNIKFGLDFISTIYSCTKDYN